MKKRVSKRLPGEVSDCAGVIQRDQGHSARVSRRSPSRPSMSLKATPPAASAAASCTRVAVEAVRDQHAAFLVGLAHGGDVDRGGGRGVDVRVAQRGVEPLGRLIQMRLEVEPGVRGVHLAAGKDVRAAVPVRQRVALDHEDFGALPRRRGT